MHRHARVLAGGRSYGPYMSTSIAPTAETSTSDAPATTPEGLWARLDRAFTRLVLDDPTMPELPQPDRKSVV